MAESVAWQALKQALVEAATAPELDAPQGEKRKHSERFSRALAVAIASGLRPHFKGIEPLEGSPSVRVRSATGKLKEVDVALVSAQGGLELGVSVKTVTQADAKTGRFGHNFSGRDYELQAEAIGLHGRFPYCVLVAVHFMPVAAASDGKAGGHSSFAAAVNRYFNRAGRDRPDGPSELFERVFVGLYSAEGEIQFWDVAAEAPPAPTTRHLPPKNRAPGPEEGALTFEEFLDRVVALFQYRNNARLEFSDESAEEVDVDSE